MNATRPGRRASAIHRTAPYRAVAAALALAIAPALSFAPTLLLAAAPATHAPDPCAGVPRCFNAGPFTAEVLQLTSSSMQNARHHTIKMTMRFRNVSDQPLILGYHATSSAAVDNLGNRYIYGRPGTHDVSVQGIGIVESQKADPQFQLAAGQSRNASFQVIRFNAARTEIGTAFNYDLTIDQLTVLSGGQSIRTVRSDALSFPNLGANIPTAALLPTSATGDATVDQVAQKVLDLFKKKK
ncbi:MAG: hypothetical protein ABI885_04575 [Gammaproteobacteria bacterium]